MHRALAATLLLAVEVVSAGRAAAQTTPRTLEPQQYARGFCIVRPGDYVEKIVQVKDALVWATCAGAALASAKTPPNTRCKKPADMRPNDVIHVREIPGTSPPQLVFTLARGANVVLDRVPLEPGPNPHRPLWLAAKTEDFLYYLYLRDGGSHQGELTKEFWVEGFDANDPDCLDELPTVPNVVSSDCDALSARLMRGGAKSSGAFGTFQSPVSPGPEYARAMGACDTVPTPPTPAPVEERSARENRQ